MLRFVDGFDHYLVSDVTRKWTAATAAALSGIDPTYARPGSAGKGIRFSSQNSVHLRKVIGAQATWIVGFAIRFNTTITVSKTIFTFLDSAGAEQCSLRHNGSGVLVFTRGGTVLGTAASPTAVDTWIYIEIKVTIGNSAAYEVRVNGSSVISGTGDTQTHASESTASGFILGTTDLGTSQDIDDFYACDGQTGDADQPNNDFLGPVRITTLRPNNAGNSTDMVPAGYGDNFANVQDDACDGDTTFNMSSTPGDLDLFSMEDMPSGTVLGVQVSLVARQDAGAARTIRPVWRIGGSNYNGSSISTAGSYENHRQCYDVSPATGIDWTASEINGAELGVELVS